MPCFVTICRDNVQMITPSLQRLAWLSIATALATIVLKTLAWYLTDSVGLLSDALESGVNLAGAMMALSMLRLAAMPPDERHAYGHSKAEYFSSAFEGMLIFVAAISIGMAAVERLFAPRPLEQLGIGLAISVFAAVLNFLTARVLLRHGRGQGSIALEADGHHLMTDVLTSVGVVAGVAAAGVTGWLWLDPLLALAVAFHILFTGWQLLRRSLSGLMDEAVPKDVRHAIDLVLAEHRRQGVGFHALLTRQAGSRVFVSVHLLVPGAWTVQHGHELAERIEADIRAVVPRACVLTHLEPLEDPASQADISLDRSDG